MQKTKSQTEEIATVKPTATTMRIYQMSATFDSREDRIRLRISTQCKNELIFWFTRRFTHALLPKLQDLEQKETLKSAPTAQKLMGDEGKVLAQKTHRKQVLEETDFKTPYKEIDHSSHETQDNMLVVEMNITPQTDKSYVVRFADENSKRVKEGAEVSAYSISFNEKMFVSLVHLLETQSKAAKW